MEPSKQKILYVDDEEINLTLFEINLESKYVIFTSESGFKALVIIKENQDILVVISDMKMPVMNGLDFIRKAKEINSNIAYFILTGYGLTDELNEAINEGLILDCLSKPFEMKEIDERIQNTINMQ